MATYKAVWIGGEPGLHAASVILTEQLYPPASAVSLTEVEDAAGRWRLDAYFAERPDADALASVLSELGLGEPSIEQLPDIDWVAHSLEGLGVVEAGRFLLYGSHDADKLPDDGVKIPILIEANQAFGTGHHPTTAGCLILLSRLAGVRPEAVLDLGCGSAVLAIAAAKLWDVDVLASDVDERSVEIARENIRINAVADLVEAIVADGFAHSEIAARAPFDFVFANILAGPLIDFAPAMAAHVGPRGRIMLAGLMANQESGVRAAYEAAGFRLLNRLDHEMWPVLLFVRV